MKNVFEEKEKLAFIKGIFEILNRIKDIEITKEQRENLAFILTKK